MLLWADLDSLRKCTLNVMSSKTEICVDPDSFLNLAHLANPAVVNLLAELQDVQ